MTFFSVKLVTNQLDFFFQDKYRFICVTREENLLKCHNITFCYSLNFFQHSYKRIKLIIMWRHDEVHVV